MTATVLLTGATGYIASHTWLALLAAGHRVVGIDNFSNSSPEVLNRLARLAGTTPRFERVDVCDAAALDALFTRERIDATVHFAARKAVGESTAKPLEYYRNNVGGLLAVSTSLLLDALVGIVGGSLTLIGIKAFAAVRAALGSERKA